MNGYTKNLFDLEVEDYYIQVRVGNYYSNNYIEYGSNDNRHKTESIK